VTLNQTVVFPIDPADCVHPQGMAVDATINPSSVLLGCNGASPNGTLNSLIFEKKCWLTRGEPSTHRPRSDRAIIHPRLVLIRGRSHPSVVLTIERPQIDCIDHPAGRAAHPQKPIARFNGGADRGRKDPAS
jgi:hypothetical protein